MGSLEDIVPRFTILDDTRPDDMSLPAFMVSTTRGFLPRMDPIVSLPPEFDPLESILQRMPVKTLSGEPGLLAQGKLGDAVTTELPDLTDQVEKYKDNLPLMNALYRDYSFLASAYLLEPCHERFMRGEEYGLARDVLPANVARPIAKCAALYALFFLLFHPLHQFFTLPPSLRKTEPNTPFPAVASSPSWSTPARTRSSTTASSTRRRGSLRITCA
jgi:indoleamine 2,3-dioxygenase